MEKTDSKLTFDFSFCFPDPGQTKFVGQAGYVKS